MFGSKLAFNFVDRFVEFDKLLTRNTQAQIAALEDDDDAAACFDEREKAALQLTREVVLDVRASEETLAQARRHLPDREIVELILMAGFYITLARLTETLGVETEPPMVSALVRDIERRVAAKKKGMPT